MLVATWYYCNLLDEVSVEVPVVQAPLNAVDGGAKVPAVRPTAEVALGAEVDDELAVGRSTYVLAAAFAATVDSKAVKVEAEPVEQEAVTEPVVAETVEIEVAEPVAVEKKPEVAKEEDASPIEEEPTAPVAVDKVEEEAIDDAAADVVHEVIEEALTAEENSVTVEAEVEETVSDVATVVETVAVVDEVLVEPVAAQAADEQEPVEVETAKEEEVASAAAEVSSDIPDQKIAVMTLDTIEELKLSIPEDEQSVHEDEVPTEADEKLVDQAATTEEEPAPAKPVTEYESETETQSEISEATVDVAKAVEEPESEIDETMVIDPVVAAKEAAAVEAQTSSFSFIPEQIRKNSYAVSSVAVAVTTAIVATLVARR
ncbi:hypothetical protein JG687_00003968 [Phytophthora cactorum]|uniref:Uncharacterized protein n=1 Tax=Phytophthora cactorum TaxID=29920 RepID=A0A8T1UQG9_9STRA|nr:hypothetical protein PC123_g4134 [Phytophthora cactorum]KAG6967983.1 hypothetical protein JG687_00003968 [Phytophthora cactorum]